MREEIRQHCSATDHGPEGGLPLGIISLTTQNDNSPTCAAFQPKAKTHPPLFRVKVNNTHTPEQGAEYPVSAIAAITAHFTL